MFSSTVDTLSLKRHKIWYIDGSDSVEILHKGRSLSHLETSRMINYISFESLTLCACDVGNAAYYFVGQYEGASGRGVDYSSVVVVDSLFSLLCETRSLMGDSVVVGDYNEDDRWDVTLYEYTQQFYLEGRENPGWLERQVVQCHGDTLSIIEREIVL